MIDKIEEYLNTDTLIEFSYRDLTRVGYVVNTNNTKDGKVVYISDCKNMRSTFNTNAYFIDKIQSITVLERSDNSENKQENEK